jgi:hypothetical protein
MYTVFSSCFCQPLRWLTESAAARVHFNFSVQCSTALFKTALGELLIYLFGTNRILAGGV